MRPTCLANMRIEWEIFGHRTWRRRKTLRTILLCVISSPIYYPADGSQWCSLCNDFGSLMALCVACRVSICIKTRHTLTGCLEWNTCIDDNNFVYHCPYCGWTLRVTSVVCMVCCLSLSS
jgi:hypothetical protein